MVRKMLMTDSEYKASGMYIGMKQRSSQMKDYIFRVRPDGLSLLNISKIDQRIRSVAKFLNRSKNIVVVGRKAISHDSIKKFGEITGTRVVMGRFMPGALTNPSYRKFYEADIVVLVDPQNDYQALNEAVKARIPVVAICDSFNNTKNVDVVIPSNNKSVKSIATLFWLLSREILRERGEIKEDSDYSYKVEDFSGGKLFDEKEYERDQERE